MKKLIAAVVIVGALVYAKGKMSGGSSSANSSPSFVQSMLSALPGNRTPESVAKDRFEKFMKNWKDGGVSERSEAQAAACLWFAGKPILGDNDSVRDAAEGFDKWRKAKQVYTEQLTYEIGDYRREKDHTVVTVKLNGTTHEIGIPDGASPLFWAD